MSDLPVVVYGAGGHAKVVCDVLQCAGHVVLGFIDDDAKRHGTMVLGLPVLGASASLDAAQHAVALAIGDNAVRGKVYEACVARGLTIVTAIHPRAVVARSATLGAGTVVMALAVVNPDAVVGRGVIVNTAAVVEHDVVIGDFAHLSPNAAMGGAARLGARAHLGIGASVLPGVSVGDEAIVGGGSVVARQVASGVVAYGVPARARRHR